MQDGGREGQSLLWDKVMVELKAYYAGDAQALASDMRKKGAAQVVNELVITPGLKPIIQATKHS